jgi:cytochrome P450
VLKESLRVSLGIVSGLPRVVGPGNVEIGGVVIPAGVSYGCLILHMYVGISLQTVVSQSGTYIHLDPIMFPNPQQFNPDGWLSLGTKNLESSLLSFSRGPRSCLGVK